MKREDVCLISLGCPKNLVDSEVMLGLMAEKGFGITTTPTEADIIVINTCSFIRNATEEALETILKVVPLRTSGSCRLLIVTGCLVQRYGSDLASEMPEVDFFLGTEEFPRIAEYIDGSHDDGDRVAIRRTSFLYDDQTPRLLSGPSYSAYVKVAEGCSRTCSFCVVPRLRGSFRSRSSVSICREASLLVDQGVKEINLVAQDITSYGLDLRDGSDLVTLLDGLCQIEGLRWIRILYAYPEQINGRILERIASSDKICNYIDLPIQHVNRKILRAMGRPGSCDALEALIQQIRREIPNVCLRTTLMVGFPGETEAEFSELLEFVRGARFERLGVFQFSPEEGTRAARMKRQVTKAIKERRFREIMELQQQISLEHNRAMVGKRVVLLIEGSLGEGYQMRGRMATQAPDIDGYVALRGGEARPGEMVEAEITKAHPYDLEGEMR
jgi:ribosomal protein S12 methylthiotransferase